MNVSWLIRVLPGDLLVLKMLDILDRKVHSKICQHIISFLSKIEQRKQILFSEKVVVDIFVKINHSIIFKLFHFFQHFIFEIIYVLVKAV